MDAVKTRVFTLPDLGEGLTEAALVQWLVAVGDEIVTDQPIAEVETAKSVVEVPSPYAGRIHALHGEEGGTLRVGAPLIEVADDLADEHETPPEHGTTPAPAPLPDEEAAGGSGNVLVGYGTTTHVGRRRSRRVAQTPTRGAASGGPVAVISPVVRHLARSAGLDLGSIVGSGDNGLILRRDVEAAISRVGDTVALESTADASVAAEVADADRDDQTRLGIRARTPLGMFRRTVAENMTRSRSEIPEATVWVDVDATELRELRERIRVGERHPSLVALIGRFTLTALARYPVFGSRLSPDGREILEFDGVNLGIAANTPRGLVVPVVRGADRMTLRELDAAIGDLSRAARDGSIAPADLRGSTFTINNYGSLGVDGSAAIINHPEVAILGIGRMIDRPWVVDRQIVPRSILQLSFVFDHRVADGGDASGFVRMIADAIEHPYDAFADL